MKLPFEIPPQVVEIRGLRTQTIGLQLVLGCYLECTGRENEFLEVQVTMEQQADFLKWLAENKYVLPLKIL